MKPVMHLKNQADAVHDPKSFLDFVEALAADREDAVALEKINPSHPLGPGANGWENESIEAFLRAAVRRCQLWRTARPRCGQPLAPIRDLPLLRQGLRIVSAAC